MESTKTAFGDMDATTQVAASRRSSELAADICQSSRSSRTPVAVRQGSWSLAGYIATQFLRTVTTLVLARHFLGPEAFGVVGLVGVFLAGLAMFSELGIVANIVQHPRGEDAHFLNTAFTIQAGRGLAIWVVASLLAYPFAWFYKQPELLPLLIAVGFAELLRGLTSTAAWMLTRRVNLRNMTLLTIFAEVMAFGLCVAWAAVHPSVWALVVRTITSAVVFAVGSHFIADRPVFFGWDSSAANEILHFGGWISLATAAHFLGSQGERLILGKLITPAELGCFSLALMICSAPAGGINQLTNQILLPMMSQAARTSRRSVTRYFLRARLFSFAIALLVAVGFVFCSKPVVALLLNSKYAMTGWILQLLGLRVALDIFASPASTVLLSFGRSKYSAAANVTRLTLLFGGLWIAVSLFGLRHAVLWLIIAQALSYFPVIAGLKRVLPEGARSELPWYGLLLALLTLCGLLAWNGV